MKACRIGLMIWCLPFFSNKISFYWKLFVVFSVSCDTGTVGIILNKIQCTICGSWALGEMSGGGLFFLWPSCSGLFFFFDQTVRVSFHTTRIIVHRYCCQLRFYLDVLKMVIIINVLPVLGEHLPVSSSLLWKRRFSSLTKIMMQTWNFHCWTWS